MCSLILFLGALLLCFAATIVTEQLDPIDNMCFRFDHQCKKYPTSWLNLCLIWADNRLATIHNDTLYIDGGKETFIDINRAGEQVGNITVGYSMINLCLHGIVDL